MDWDQLLAEHAPWLRKVILARTGEWQAVDDVFQQVALAAIAQQAPLRDPAKAAPWLHRLAVIQSARYRRRQGRTRRAQQQWAAMAGNANNAQNANGQGALVDWLLSQERHRTTRQAMQRLSARDAEILALKYGEGWSYRRIASHLGITEKAVDRRLARARAHLRRQLQSLGISEGDVR